MIDPTYTTKIKERRRTHVKYLLCSDVEVLTEIQEEETKREQEALSLQSPPTNALLIDRTQPFNPSTFIGDGWSIWKGPIDGDGLEGEEAQDQRSLALYQLDLSAIRFRTMLKRGETSITGRERLERLKTSGNICLDAKVFQTLWENKNLIPESWKKKMEGDPHFIYLDGTILCGPDGRCYVLSFYWLDKKWRWSYRLLHNNWGASRSSSVLRHKASVARHQSLWRRSVGRQVSFLSFLKK